MRTRIYLSIIGLMALSFLSVSCSKDNEGDTVKPVISLLEPEEGAVLKIGDASGVRSEMDIADNRAVTSYKINTRNNFDGHSHTRASGGGATKPFAFKGAYTDEAGQKQAYVRNHDIKAPANATPGNYHLMICCLDRSGNETHVAYNIVLNTTGGVENEHHHD